jgi:hypothetical protein
MKNNPLRISTHLTHQIALPVTGNSINDGLDRHRVTGAADQQTFTELLVAGCCCRYFTIPDNLK